MKTENPTKYYSSKQEKRIASYLGWSVVVASGARRFHPGDIQSDQFLGECKTHTTKVERIKIYKSVWNKISTEATSTFRKPVLFVDNGTQTVENTWCVLSNIFTPDSMHSVQCSGIRCSETLVSFDHQSMQASLNDSDCTTLSLRNEILLLMRLSAFKQMLET